MRKVLLLTAIVCLFGDLFAQAPQGINYQGVARDNQGKPLALQDISVRISILKNTADGDVEFAETHELKTNPFGLFTLVIGKGTTVSGLFNYISWAEGNKWLQVELDPAGTNSFQVIGSQQLMSVPYALYAEYSRNGLTAGKGISIDKNVINNAGDNDNSSTNELITGLTFDSDHKLKITEAGGIKEVDLSSLLGASQNLTNVLLQGNDAAANKISNLGAPTQANDATTKAYVDAHTDGDASATNEIQDLNLTENTLKITNNTSATSIDLSPYVNTDSQNLSNVLGINNSAGGSKITNLGTPAANTDAVTKKYVDDLDALDLDKSTTNEIQDLNLTANTLKITNNGTATSIDLSPYINTDNQNLSNVLGVNNSAGGSKITNLGTPTANTDAVTKKYVDDLDALDLDKSTTNEIQDLNLTANTLKITNNGSATSIDLSPYVNTDNQNLSNVLGVNNNAGGSRITNLGTPTTNTDAATKKYADDLAALDLDKSATNEIQNLSNTVSGTQRTINISGGTGTIIDVADADNDATNEIQSLTNSATGTQRTINISGGTGTTIDVATNLSQVLTKGNDAGTAKITNLGTPTVNTDATTKKYVDDLDALDLDKSITNEIQNLSSTVSGTQRTISISGGTGTTIDVADADNSATNELQNLAQVLTQGTNANSAGNTKITDLGTPTANTDATTKKYVDDADAILASKIATTYAFKTAFSYTNTAGVIENDKTMPFGSEDFDDFNVLASNRFTANEDGTYVFIVDGSHESILGAGAQLSLLFNGTKFPFAIIPPWGGGAIARFNTTLLFKLTAGQAVSLVADNILIGGKFSGNFFGYKL